MNSRDGSRWRNSGDWGIRAIVDQDSQTGSLNRVVDFPDGRVVDFGRSTGQDGYFPRRDGVRERLKNEGGSFTYLVLPDGGRVEFARDSSARYETDEYGIQHQLLTYLYTLKAVIDPYGNRTTYDRVNDVLTIAEPAGRWIKAHYNPDGTVDYVEASDGRIVDYTYQSQTFAPGTMPYGVLTGVNYFADQTLNASYTYHGPNVGNVNGLPLLSTCVDSMYAGAMKEIGYTYATGTNPNGTAVVFGQIKSENHRASGTAVSTLTMDDLYKRTETRGDGVSRTFQYAQNPRLGSWTDFKNVSSSQGYDAAGFVNSSTDERQNTTNFSNDPNTGNTTLTQYPLTPPDTTRAMTHASYGYASCPDTNNRDAYSGYYLFNATDALNNTTTYWRNPNKQVRWIDYPGGSSEEFSYTIAADNPYGQIYDHRLPSGTWEHFRYYSSGLLQKTWNDVDGAGAYVEYTYWGHLEAGGLEGMIKTMTDGPTRTAGKEYTAKYFYNSRGLVTEIHYPSTGLASDPHVSFGYDSRSYRTSVTDELGHQTTVVPDDYGRTISITQPIATGGATRLAVTRTREFTYERIRNGNTYGAITHTSSQWRSVWDLTFDKDNNRSGIIHVHDENDRLVEEDTGWIITNGNWWRGPEFENHFNHYNAAGNLDIVTGPSALNATGRQTTYAYDPRNRRTGETGPLSRTSAISYDVANNTTDVQLPNGKHKQWKQFDAFGQPAQALDEQNNATDFVYQWGPMKKVDTVTAHRDTDAGATENQVTNFDYDGVGRLTKTTFPDLTTEESTYPNGRLATWKTRKGVVKTISRYDARGREELNTFSDNTTPGVERKWDDAGRLSWIQNSVSRIDYSYDDAGQVTAEDDTIAGSGGAGHLTFRRYGSGQVSQLNVPGGPWLRKDYTARGQLKEVGVADSAGNW